MLVVTHDCRDCEWTLLSFLLSCSTSQLKTSAIYDGIRMSLKVLVADDDEGVRNSHKFAMEAAADILKQEYVVVETDNSVDALAKILAGKFDLILLDNDFKDGHLKGHLPGIALLQLARKEGPNTETPIVFCSAETFALLKPMVERFRCVHFPKGGYDIDQASRLFSEQLSKTPLQ